MRVVWRGWIVRVWVVVAWMIASTASAGFMAPRPASDVIRLPWQQQTMSMAMTPSGELYVGTASDLHRFDGARWESLGLDAVAPIRSLHVDRHGRVWVGGYDRFGFLDRLPDGDDRFTDLSPQFATEHAAERIADIWEFAETGETVYLRALKHLFAVDHDGKRVGAWSHAGRMGAPIVVDGTIWAQFRGPGGGLRRLHDDGVGSTPIEGTEGFADALVLSAIPFPGRILILDANARLRWFDPVSRQVTEFASGPAVGHMVQLVRIGPDAVAAAGDDGVLRVLELGNGRIHELGIGTSYQPAVLSPTDGVVLVVDDASVHRVRWPTLWRIVDALHGIRGNVRAHVAIGDRLYALSSAGIQSAAFGADGVSSDFRSEGWTTGEAWDLVGTPEELLLADSMQVLRIRAGTVTPVSADDLYPRRFEPTLAGDGYWIGTEHGVARLRRTDGEWGIDGFAETPGIVIHSLAECDGLLFAGSMSWGAYRVVLDDGRPVRLERLGTEAGVPDHAFAESFALDGQCYLSVPGALLRWQGNRFAPDVSLGLEGRLDPHDVARVERGADGLLWVIATSRILFRPDGGDWSLLATLDPEGIEYRGVSLLPDGRMIIAQRDEIWQLSAPPQPVPPPDALVPRVTGIRAVADGSPGALALDGTARIQGGREGLRFTFTDGTLFSDGLVEYAYRVHGLDAGWSDWTSWPEAQLGAVPPGPYRLDLRVRHHGLEALREDAATFEVLPRWYESNATRMAGIIAAIGVLWALIALWYRGHLRRLTDMNQRLDQLVGERTAMWQRANLELKQQADRDGLTGVANRRVFDRELAARVALGRQDGAPFALLMVDVDHFKRFNDEHGHLRGDEVLKQVAGLMQGVLGGDGLLARYGGEEFAILLFDDCANARATGERIRSAIEAGAGGITVSIGLACFDRTRHERPDQIIDAADHALYEAKGQGRNRMVVA